MGFIIGASSVGTLIEWYDFYIFGMLAKVISSQFFPEDSGTAALLSTLAIFAAGFIVRPFGALVFGRLGDLIGRKYTFLLTLVLMGGSTFAIGLIPGYATIGWWAPLLVLLLRLVQGLALGGEYGGAATYVAEHAPINRRGFWTSWIQTTATLGLFLALGVIILIRKSQSITDFESEWGGWRYPFWISFLLVFVSIIIRMRMSESPLFEKIKSSGKTSKNPLKESFGNKANFKMVLLALFGAVMGQGVVWYTGQFYAQSFLENTCGVNFEDSRNIILVAILFATPFFVIFGSWSDRVGRKWIILTGMLVAACSYYFIYDSMLNTTSATTKRALFSSATEPSSVVTVDSKRPNVLHRITKYDTLYSDGAKFSFTKTDTITLLEKSVPNTKELKIVVDSNANALVYSRKAGPKTVRENGSATVTAKSISKKHALSVEKALDRSSFWYLSFLVFIQVFFVTMVYGPIAAFLVEMFPTKIRYTSMSLPYHIGNGVFGGLVPFLSTLMVELSKSNGGTGNPLIGLGYPISVALLCFIIGTIYLKNKPALSE